MSVSVSSWSKGEPVSQTPMDEARPGLQGLPGRCDQAWEWLAGLACATAPIPGYFAVGAVNACWLPRGCWVEGKLGSSALWGSHHEIGESDWVRVHRETVRTAPRYRQVTPATLRYLLNPTFFLVSSQRDRYQPQRQGPLSIFDQIDNDNGHRGAADLPQYRVLLTLPCS